MLCENIKFCIFSNTGTFSCYGFGVAMSHIANPFDILTVSSLLDLSVR